MESVLCWQPELWLWSSIKEKQRHRASTKAGWSSAECKWSDLKSITMQHFHGVSSLIHSVWKSESGCLGHCIKWSLSQSIAVGELSGYFCNWRDVRRRSALIFFTVGPTEREREREGKDNNSQIASHSQPWEIFKHCQGKYSVFSLREA